MHRQPIQCINQTEIWACARAGQKDEDVKGGQDRPGRDEEKPCDQGQQMTDEPDLLVTTWGTKAVHEHTKGRTSVRAKEKKD